MITLYITPAEDAVLDLERARRITQGERRRGHIENSTLIREAIHLAYGAKR